MENLKEPSTKEWIVHGSSEESLSDQADRSVGTKYDVGDMKHLGKRQELKRNYGFMTILGFASMVMCSWEILLTLFDFVLTDGGTADLFWGFIAVAFIMFLVYASLAEMASMSPTAAGQYHFVSQHAPPQIQQFLSYLVGWLCTTGWQVYLAGVCFMVGTIVQGLIILGYPNYVPHAWHGSLLTMSVIVVCALFHRFASSRLPLLEGIVLCLHICGFFAIVVTLWVLSPRGNAKEVLLQFTNNGGWSTTGGAAMVGLITPLSVVIGYDSPMHMSEEVMDAGIVLPKAIMWSVYLNMTLAFIFAITICFTLGNTANILATDTGYPFLQIFYNSTKSVAAVNILTTVMLICLMSCAISEIATSSRQIWSFARDQGLPGSAWLSMVDNDLNIPLRAIYISIVVSCLLSLINIGSSTALDAINSLGGVAILTSYLISIGCLIWRRLYGKPLPPRRWSLGAVGLYINIAAFILLLPLWIISFFPLYAKPTASGLNWSPVMFVAIVLFAIFWYFFKARHTYKGPVVLMEEKSK